MIRVSVIIPYFQRKSGILRRALMSVLQQRLTPDIGVDVIVVDDGSPIPAKSEVENLDFKSPFNLILITQKNGGVAAARNTALRNVSSETKYIAFLDSDDIWAPEHLPIAISALEQGFDYYFCDNRRIGSYDSYLTLISFNPPPSPIDIPSAIEGLHEVDKEFLLGFSLRIWVSSTPTVVYRKSINLGVEFDVSLKAAEDCLFFIQLISRCQRICYSPQVWVTCADGIGIWESRFGWDTPAHRSSQLSRVLAAQEMRKKLPLSKENKQQLDFTITRYRRFFAYLTVRWLLKKREWWSTEIGQMARSDPKFWLWYPLCVLYVASFFLLRLYTPLQE
jgi:succinoglycan biosynthesis protein ExoW